MFRPGNSSGAPALDLSIPSYCEKVRSAHALADLLKRTRPHLFEKVAELQATIVRCQKMLDESKIRREKAQLKAKQEARSGSVRSLDQAQELETFRELDAALDELLSLRHKGQMAK